MNLPGLISPRRLERKANVESQRTHRSGIAHAKTTRESQIANRHVERALGNLAEIDEDCSIKFFPNRPAQFKGTFYKTKSAERIIVGGQRAQPAPAVAAHAFFAARVKTLEQR